MGYFSDTQGQLWPKFELIQDFMHVFVTCKFASLKDQINSNLEPDDQWSCKRSPDIDMGLGQPRVIIHINFVELESPMVNAKFQDHRTFLF